jgi:hypothetical protein
MATSPTAQNPQRSKMSRLTCFVAVASLTVLSVTLPASASIKPHDPPIAPSASLPTCYDQTDTCPNNAPRYEAKPAEWYDDGLDATWFALSSVSVIAFAGAGLGITVRAKRRRDHSALHS